MSAQPVDRIERRRMSFEDYLALPEDIRAEWVDGEVIVTPPSSMPHNRIGLRLARSLEDHLPGLVVYYEMGLRTAERKYRIPDLAVVPSAEDAFFTEQTPVLVVEIFSPSTATEDTVRKSTEYLALGVGQYWLVDRELRRLTVMRNGGDGWEVELALEEGRTTGEVVVGDHGVVPLDLDLLLAP